MTRKKIKDIEIRVKKILDSDFFGAYNSHFIGNGLEFSDLRAYVAGDSVKRIDWKTTARHNEVFVKNFEQERNLQLLFFLDVGKTMQFGTKLKTKVDTLLELFFTLGLAAITSGDNVGAYVYNGKVHQFIDFGKGEEAIQKIAFACSDLQVLTKEQNSESYFEYHLKNLAKLRIKNSLICMCTDTLDFDLKLLKGINARNEIVYCNIFDSFENNLWDENLLLSFGHAKKSISSLFHGEDKKRKYRRLRRDKIQSLNKNLISSRIEHLEFDETSHIYIKLLQYFHKNQIGK